MDASQKRPGRRSHPNLQLLTVTPLTPNFPLPATTGDETGPAASQQHVTTTPKSYLEPRSLPQSPSILSRSNSRTRQRPTSHSSVAISDLADGLERGSLMPHVKKGSHSRSSSSKALRPPDNTGWILQTASTLTMATAESKGQAWLATRTSSTSLADANAPIERLESYTADDEFSPVSYRRASRSQSRYGSRGTSRRGSRVGIMIPAGFKTPGERDDDDASGYFENVAVDFVDNVDEEAIVEDDGEMRRLVWGRVGGWVDWAVGWMDFREDLEEENQEVEPEDGDGESNAQQRQGTLRIQEPARSDKRRRRRQPPHESVEGIKDLPPAPENQGLVGDAAWLLGLAKNSLT